MNETSVTLHISTVTAICNELLCHRIISGLFRTRCQCGVRIERCRDPETGELWGYSQAHAEHVAEEVRRTLCLSDVLMVDPGEKIGLNLEEYDEYWRRLR